MLLERYDDLRGGKHFLSKFVLRLSDLRAPERTAKRILETCTSMRTSICTRRLRGRPLDKFTIVRSNGDDSH